MPRPRNKEDLLTAAKENYSKLMDFIASMSEVEMNTPFDFSSDAGKKEAHWSRDSFPGGLLYKITRKENPLDLEKDELEDYLRFAKKKITA